MSAHKLSIPPHRPLFGPARLFLYLAISSFLLLIVSAVLSDTSLDVLIHPIDWLRSLDVAAALDTLSNAAEVVAAVLAIATTVVAIVVELAANRYSHEITRIFLREPMNFLVLGLFVLTTLQCVWIGAVLSESGADAVLPQAGFALTLGMVTLSLLLLVPYIYFVFTFLSPISVIERICRDAYRMVISVGAKNVAYHQKRVEESIDQLQDVARSAIEQGDRGIAMAAVDALSGFISDYLRVRSQLPAGWFNVTDSVAADPDFIALAPETMDEVRTQGIWLERKVFRRFLSLVGQSAIRARDVANLVGINTQRIASEFGADNANLLELCLRGFNSYLRVTISAGDARTAYFMMNQYRMLAVEMLRNGKADVAMQIAGHIKEYGVIGHEQGLSFLLVSASYDVKELFETAYLEESEAADDMLDCLLQLDMEIKEESEQDSLLGVRRSQIQVATLLLQHGDEERVQRVIDDLKGERFSRLERLRLMLETDDRPQFWELMDRGVNFAYLVPERRQYLEELFQRMKESSPPIYETDPASI
jgi:hypothetical protein